jgi:hypothetical protein
VITLLRITGCHVHPDSVTPQGLARRFLDQAARLEFDTHGTRRVRKRLR